MSDTQFSPVFTAIKDAPARHPARGPVPGPGPSSDVPSSRSEMPPFAGPNAKTVTPTSAPAPGEKNV